MKKDSVDLTEEVDLTSEETAVASAGAGTTATAGSDKTRPRPLRPRATLKEGKERRRQSNPRAIDGSNPTYVQWLVDQSMLADADALSRQFSGRASMQSNPFAHPDPRRAINAASVWYTAYPMSLMTAPGESFLGTLASEKLWQAFQHIGINALHTGPVKQAGGLSGRRATPSVDGNFDRISTQIDPLYGTEDDFRKLCQVAEDHSGAIIDDIVPGHTGKGADFRLAEMGYEDYPGIYHMVEIPEEDWSLLPEVVEGEDSANLDVKTEALLAERGYIIGALQRVIFYAEGVKETNWSATDAVTGTDGKVRRWVYLHYFKQGQPSINWLDPTFSGMRLVIGDALHALGDLGANGLRLDANGFLGIEKSSDDGEPAWSEGHPLSQAANQVIAGMTRKVGGFTFQELNLTIEDIRDNGRVGADLSYDFVNRPAYHHALATADTEFLRLTLRTSLELGVNPVSLVHALQNHDELTYELVHWATLHRNDEVTFRGREINGGQLAEEIRADLVEHLTGDAADYNMIFTTNGISSTTASVIAAIQGNRTLDAIDDASAEKIKNAHLLLAMFNAWQPGVFALSGWDLTGLLTLPADEIPELLEGGDTRWIHRGAHDLTGSAAESIESDAGMPRARSLYGTLPEQLQNDNSFANGLQRIVSIRESSGVTTGTQIDIPDVAHSSMLVMIHRIDNGNAKMENAPLQATILNFSGQEIEGTVRSDTFSPRMTVTDQESGEQVTQVDDLLSFKVTLAPYQGLFFRIEG